MNWDAKAEEYTRCCWRTFRHVLVGAFCIGVAVAMIGYATHHGPPLKPVLIRGHQSLRWDGNDGGTDWQRWIEAANVALLKWRAVLPDVEMPEFYLTSDLGHCGSEVAHTFREYNEVEICRRGGGADRVTTMLHEIGHLLGVPHIAGDPLMEDRIYQAVQSPTPTAIAIAKNGGGFKAQRQ